MVTPAFAAVYNSFRLHRKPPPSFLSLRRLHDNSSLNWRVHSNWVQLQGLVVQLFAARFLWVSSCDESSTFSSGAPFTGSSSHNSPSFTTSSDPLDGSPRRMEKPHWIGQSSVSPVTFTSWSSPSSMWYSTRSRVWSATWRSSVCRQYSDRSPRLRRRRRFLARTRRPGEGLRFSKDGQ